MVFLTLFAAIITADKTKKEPKLAAIANPQLENAADKKIKKAADLQEDLDALYAKWEALEERQ